MQTNFHMARSIVVRLMLKANEDTRTAVFDHASSVKRVLPDETVIDLFSKAVERHSDNIAVELGEKSLSYQQLDVLTDRISESLARIGITSGSVVAVCFERDFEMVPSIISILKAGAAYVVLEPSLPDRLLRDMVGDCEPQLVITKTALVRRITELTSLVVAFDDLQTYSTAQVEAETARVSPSDTAYMLYTSGSTGKRKAAKIRHSSLVNAYYGWLDVYGLDEADRILQTASFGFDVFAGDWVRSLCSGATLVINPYNLILRPDRNQVGRDLLRLLTDSSISIAEFTPPVLRDLLRHIKGSGRVDTCLRLVIVGADAWYESDSVMFYDAFGDSTQLINSYGMTEATVDSTFYEVPRTGDPMSRRSIIGRPFLNTDVFVVRDGELVQPGEEGELWVGGAGLAEGYLNRPELNAKSFVDCDFPDGSSRRLYRSGDRVKMHDSGNLEFLGRLDGQVELGAIRIEIGEIEAAVQEIGEIEENAVLISGKDHRLVNCFFSASAKLIESDLASITERLRGTLPSYAVPKRFVQLESLPLTSNGKIDRNLLKSLYLERAIDDVLL
jgi:amino acid adenylation domain-containing protein